MDFEHIVVVDDASAPVAPAGRAALVAGLRLLAVRPQVYDADIDDVELAPRPDGTLARRIVRGNLVIDDRVTLGADGRALEQSIEAPAALAGATRRITIEEPARGVLVLRFRYGSKEGAGPAASDLSDAERGVLHRAYLDKDRELVARFRDLVNHGALETLLALHSPPGWR